MTKFCFLKPGCFEHRFKKLNSLFSLFSLMYLLYAKPSNRKSLRAKHHSSGGGETSALCALLLGRRQRVKSVPHMLEKQNKITLEAMGIKAGFEAQTALSTSQGGGEKEVGPVFLDQALCNHLEGRPSPQLADGVHQVWVKWQGQTTTGTKTVPLFHRQAVDLPSTKLPGNTQC